MNSGKLINVSLVLNLVLIGLTAWFWAEWRTQRTDVRLLPQTKVVTNFVKRVVFKNAEMMPPPVPTGRNFNWQDVEAEDYPTYLSNLISIGCPAETIQDIILTDVAKTYNARRAAIQEAGVPLRYWEADDRGAPTVDPEFLKQWDAINLEQRTLIKDLLGLDLDEAIAQYPILPALPPEPYMEFLPKESQDQVRKILVQYDQRDRDIREKARGLFLESDTTALEKAAHERDEAIAKLMTPQQLEQYRLRNSDTAIELRTSLKSFRPTESEFTTLYRSASAFQQWMNDSKDRTSEEVAKKSAEWIAQTRNLLGEQRFADYQRVSDPEYPSLDSVRKRFDLAPEVIDRTRQIKTLADNEQRRIEQDHSLTLEQRQNLLKNIRGETEKAVETVMGAPAFKAYREIGGQWIDQLNNLSPDAPATDPVPPTYRSFPPFPILFPVLPPVPPGM